MISSGSLGLLACTKKKEENTKQSKNIYNSFSQTPLPNRIKNGKKYKSMLDSGQRL